MAATIKAPVSINADRACFVCGDENPIGLKAKFVVDPETNRSTASLTIGTHFQGWQGVVHGGIIASLLDEAAIYACRALSIEAVTAEMTVRYRKPVTVDSPLLLKAEVLSFKRQIALVRSQVIVDTDIMADAEIKIYLLNH